jgi:hypothetical protein
MKPGYVPTDEERKEARRRVLQFRAWVLGFPDPGERIPLDESKPQTTKGTAAPPTDTSRHPRG